MDNQKERSRLDEDNLCNPDTDVTRSERQQRSSDANQNRNIASTEGQQGDRSEERSREQTGGHQEGQYDKQSRKPMVNKGFD